MALGITHPLVNLLSSGVAKQLVPILSTCAGIIIEHDGTGPIMVTFNNSTPTLINGKKISAKGELRILGHDAVMLGGHWLTLGIKGAYFGGPAAGGDDALGLSANVRVTIIDDAA